MKKYMYDRKREREENSKGAVCAERENMSRKMEGNPRIRGSKVNER